MAERIKAPRVPCESQARSMFRYALSASRFQRQKIQASLCVVAVVLTSAVVNAKKIALVPKLDNSIKPVHFLLYHDCRTDSLSCDFATQEGFAAFTYQTSGTSATAILHVQRKEPEGPLSFRTGLRSEFQIPLFPVTMNVVLYNDTAILRIDSMKVVVVKPSPQLILDTARFVPDNVVCAQLFSKQPKCVRLFLDSAARMFGASLAPAMLPVGIYPCLPTPWVSRTTLGRRSGSANATAAGYLLFLEIRDKSRRTEIERWVRQRQGDAASR